MFSFFFSKGKLILQSINILLEVACSGFKLLIELCEFIIVFIDIQLEFLFLLPHRTQL
jgi:hypothetical protein